LFAPTTVLGLYFYRDCLDHILIQLHDADDLIDRRSAFDAESSSYRVVSRDMPRTSFAEPAVVAV
jgi:hypothetical protein